MSAATVPPPTLPEQLRAFRETHAPRRLMVGSTAWEYVASGAGDETVLLMHGGTGSAESMFRYTLALERGYRVIAPTIPASITSVDEALAGVDAILAAERRGRVHCLGFSMGGMLAQVWLRRHPERVRSLVLFHVPPPGKAYAARLERQTSRRKLLGGRIGRAVVRFYLSRELARYADAPKEDREFWLEYYLRTSSDARTDNQLRIVFDYLRNREFSSGDLAAWGGPVLIIETATDAVIPAAERARLRELYPNAVVHTFASGGHLGNGLFRIDTTLGLIRDHLARATG